MQAENVNPLKRKSDTGSVSSAKAARTQTDGSSTVRLANEILKDQGRPLCERDRSGESSLPDSNSNSSRRQRRLQVLRHLRERRIQDTDVPIKLTSTSSVFPDEEGIAAVLLERSPRPYDHLRDTAEAYGGACRALDQAWIQGSMLPCRDEDRREDGLPRGIHGIQRHDYMRDHCIRDGVSKLMRNTCSRISAI